MKMDDLMEIHMVFDEVLCPMYEAQLVFYRIIKYSKVHRKIETINIQFIVYSNVAQCYICISIVLCYWFTSTESFIEFFFCYIFYRKIKYLTCKEMFLIHEKYLDHYSIDCVFYQYPNHSPV